MPVTREEIERAVRQLVSLVEDFGNWDGSSGRRSTDSYLDIAGVGRMYRRWKKDDSHILINIDGPPAPARAR